MEMAKIFEEDHTGGVRETRGPRGVRQLKELLADANLGEDSDRVIWRWHKKGLFTVKSTYLTLNDGGIRDLYAGRLWSLRVPFKVQILLWLVLKRRLLTSDNLVKRGWVKNTVCVLRGCEEETIDHLFVRCVFALFVLGMCNGAIWIEEDEEEVRSIWEKRMTTKGGRRKF